MQHVIVQPSQELRVRHLVREILLACGIFSSLVYVAANLVGAMRWKGYSLTSQTISELSAIGVPSRGIVVMYMLLYSVLMIGFGIGVWQLSSRNHALKITGYWIVGFGIVCLVALLTPMHQREVLAKGGGTLVDTLHIIFTIADVILISFIMGFGAAAFGNVFRMYSLVSILTFLLFGVVTGIYGPWFNGNLPTPYTGITERISMGVFLLWVMTLAIMLLLVEKKGASSTTNTSGKTLHNHPVMSEPSIPKHQL